MLRSLSIVLIAVFACGPCCALAGGAGLDADADRSKAFAPLPRAEQQARHYLPSRDDGPPHAFDAGIDLHPRRHDPRAEHLPPGELVFAGTSPDLLTKYGVFRI